MQELLSLSKKLAAVRGPPRVIRVQQMSQSPRPAKGGAIGSFDPTGTSADIDGKATRNDVQTFSSATATWKAQQVVTARLHRQWREGHDRAARALSLLRTFAHGMS